MRQPASLPLVHKLLGAEKVVGFDLDPCALENRRENASMMGVDVEFVQCDISRCA